MAENLNVTRTLVAEAGDGADRAGLPDWNASRREAAARYGELLAGLVETPEDDPGHVYHMYCVRSPERACRRRTSRARRCRSAR